MAKIGLYVQQNMHYPSGPMKVFHNLRAGLETLGHTVVVNQMGDLVGCLHNGPYVSTLPSQTLMGPNFFTLPTDNPPFWSVPRNFTVPSEWTRKLYSSFAITSMTKFRVWPVGIDQHRFCAKPTTSESKFDCLLYYKNRSPEDLVIVTGVLDKFNQSFVLLKYGEYSENDFIGLLMRCRYAVLLTNTESQGIAYMEMLSCEVPCFVLNQNEWNGHVATSVPYFDDRCGIISTIGEGDQKGSFLEDFDRFLVRLPEYHPREYILEKHTLEKSAQRYIDMLEKFP